MSLLRVFFGFFPLFPLKKLLTLTVYSIQSYGGIRILLLAYRQYSQYISFLRSFDWQWSRTGGLAVYETGRINQETADSQN